MKDLILSFLEKLDLKKFEPMKCLEPSKMLVSTFSERELIQQTTSLARFLEVR
jgi:hypothetical protein